MRFGGICLVVAALWLGACSGDPEPKEPDPSASSAAPSPTATPPEMPDQAKEAGPEGASAVVFHWVQTYNYAAATGDVAGLELLSADSCASCMRYIDIIADTYANGGYFRGGEWSVSEFEVEEFDDRWDVYVRVEAPPGTQSDGNETGPTEAENTDLVFGLRKTEPVVVALERAE